MTTPLLPEVRVDEPGDLIAALPHLLAFHPADSVVVVAMSPGRPSTISLTLRVSLPAPRHRYAVARQLMGPLAEHDAESVAVVVVGGGSADPPGSLPHRGLVEAIEERAREEGLLLTCALWTSATTKGSRWFCYDHVECAGTVPDPDGSELAAASAAVGMVTFPSREAFAEVVAPDDPAAVAARGAILDREVDKLDPEWFCSPVSARKGLALVRRAVADAAERLRPLGDEEVVELAIALSDLRVRDASLAFAIGSRTMEAERLFAELTRLCPAPERSQPAALLAFSAYLRGDGALASVALEQAELACPGHRLAALLRAALDAGLPPQRLEAMAVRAARSDWLRAPEGAAP
jgi:hypothetical protein